MSSIIEAITPSPTRVALSGISGSISLACWIVLLLPQLIEQWRLKSAEGISPLFLLLWFFGDITNLLGSIFAKLLPQVTLLAVWFFIADFAVLVSYMYYTYFYHKNSTKTHHYHETAGHSNHTDETTNLINSSSTTTTTTTRKSSRKSRRRSSALDDLCNETDKDSSIFKTYILPISFVFLAGFIGYFSSSRLNSTPDDSPDLPIDTPDKISIVPQILGYISAMLYLTARLPQIYQNYVKKSCKGLSLLFFIFSTLGNLTYSLQILFYRNDYEYVILNLSWLVGSLGTIFEDAIIFLQFYLYKETKDEVIDEV